MCLPVKHSAFVALLTALLMSAALTSHAQIVDQKNDSALRRDSVIRDFDSRPYFGLYKDNYFIFGPAIGRKITDANTNVKFQISVSQRLTKRVLPFGSYLYLFYTQKVFWNVLQNSMPMTDLNFNPGIGITKPIFSDERLIGKISLVLEHESNGRDSIASRSWNKVTLGGNIILDPNLMVYGKIWIPIVDGKNNKDILDYCGVYQSGVQFISDNRRFFGNITVVKRRKGWFSNNVIVELGYLLSRKSNQYIFMQYYNGYGEGLLDYNKYHSQLRIGICIKPPLFSDF